MKHCEKHDMDFRHRCMQCYFDDKIAENPRKYVMALECRFCGETRYSEHSQYCRTQEPVN